MLDGINRKKKIVQKTPPKEADILILPDESDLANFEIENPVAEVPLPLKKRRSFNIFASPIGLRTRKEKKIKEEKPKKSRKPIKKKLIFKIFSLFFFIFLTFFIIIQVFSTKNKINKLTVSAKDHLEASMNLVDEGNMPGSITEANKANDDLRELKLLVQSWGQDIKYLSLISPENSKIIANERLLDATYLIVNTVSDLNQSIAGFSGKDNSVDFTKKGSDFLFNIDSSSKAILTIIDRSQNNLTKSKDELSKARKGLDGDTAKEIDNAVSMIDKTLLSIDFTKTLIEEDLPWLSGKDGKPKKILILFQNNSELRGGSGGSLGSFGVANFSDGKLVNIDFGKNIFKIDQAFEATGEHIDPPATIKWLRADKTWTLKDSGWSVDGPEAMQKIMWFYNKETGETVDGTIMIDSSAVISLLDKLGSINLPQYGKTIDSTNFRAEIENEVHNAYFDRPGALQENEPKKIISEMMPIFLARFFDSLGNKEKSVEILSALSKFLKNKDILFYFNKSGFQDRLNKMDYSGVVYPATGDYLYANNSNIDGAKSSLSMEQFINLSVNIDNAGRITDQLVLERQHNGSGVSPDGINKNFVRLLLPENTKIDKFSPLEGYFEDFFDKGYSSPDKFITTHEYGKSVLNFWQSTKPKEKSRVEVNYSPSYQVKTDSDFSYILSLQKQPGANPDHISLKINYPAGFTPTNVKNVENNANTIDLNFTLDKDRIIKINFKKQ